jgi:shikimate kinase
VNRTVGVAGPGDAGSTQVVLVGLMGAGKSTVGALVAAALGRELVDVDVAITRRTGRSVRELWEEGGEAAYRGLESSTVLDTLDGPDVVLAAPGGVVLDPQVRNALGPAQVVWLRADPRTLGARVRAGDHRPLLGDDPTADLAAMASARAELYAGVADLVVDTGAAAPDEAATVILDWLSTRGITRA